jgi:hypothetical protein
MPNWLRELDDLLRGRKSRAELLAEGTAHLKLGPHVAMAVLLGILYGLSMALYSALNRTPPAYAQFVASAIKVPALFILTLLVSFPSLYVFSALTDAEVNPLSELRVIVSSVVVTLAVLASFAPITVFFTFTTSSYPFMKLLNVFFFVVAALVGLGFLLKMLRQLDQARALTGRAKQPAVQQPALAAPDPPPPVRPRKPVGGPLFQTWLIVYALVGAQMAWVLRPFIGSPHLPFEWFRPRGGNAFIDVFRTIGELVGK